MNLNQAMYKRHAVRLYMGRPLEKALKDKMLSYVEECNKESGLRFQFITDEPKAFGGMKAHYGKFSGVTNYLALVGQNCDNFEEKCGYYGEKVALYAQTLGLNSCWVALTYGKGIVKRTVNKGEKLCMVIAIGYGANSGIAHKSKPAEKVYEAENPPEWFLNGVKAALLAPTAMNQQKFKFYLNGNEVKAKAGSGFYTKTDLGIAKLHFELGAGKDNFSWSE